jgi:hypothetical protein
MKKVERFENAIKELKRRVSSLRKYGYDMDCSVVRGKEKLELIKEYREAIKILRRSLND